MVTPVRPGVPSEISPIPRQDRSAAQRAFFEAALGRGAVGGGQDQSNRSPASQTSQATQSSQTARATTAPAAVQPTIQTARAGALNPPASARGYVQKIPVNLPADPPARILRPGSLLDIKV